MSRLSRADWLCCAVLWLAVMLIFAAGAGRLGFYYDDAGNLVDLPAAGLHALWGFMRTSIRGRNLHALWLYLFFHAAPDPAGHLPLLHVVQSALDGLVAAGFFIVLRLLRLPAPPALIAAALFAVWPIHGESHFGLTAASALLMSTLLVLVFAATSAVLTEHVLAQQGSGRWWLWLLDAAAFIGALFTYDQVFFVLLALAVLRVGAAVLRRRWSFLAAHLPHLAAGILYVALRGQIDAASYVAWRPDTWRLFRVNLPATVSNTIGPAWFRHVAPLYSKVTPTDWLLALLVAASLTFLAARLPVSPRPRVSASLLPAILFYLAAYLPIWLWHMSPRHHFLPSAGLFAAVAVFLAWLMGRFRRAAVPVLLVVGAATAILAAADRGESRFWEESFTARRQLFAEIQADLADADVLVLDDFPATLGPAPFVTPHDAVFAPRLLGYSTRPGFAASIGGVPAPGGIFLFTKSIYGPQNFRYFPTDRILCLRYDALEHGRLVYRKNPPPEALYTVVSSQARPLAARREGNGLVVALPFPAGVRPGAFPAALFSYRHGTGFHRWSRLDRNFALEPFPVLLSGPAQTVRLHSFPATDRIQVEFFEASRDNAPVYLGRTETAVEP
ncbi:MAG: hypothetical protein HY238_18305 [Acidobacteria bacterium]|nr:hypothetical protein [Acidobacteriota bacterium]